MQKPLQNQRKKLFNSDAEGKLKNNTETSKWGKKSQHVKIK